MRKATRQQTRNHNTRLVLKTIYDQEGISRADGNGIVLDGRPLYGDGFAAGETGHVVVAKDGPLCVYGNRGCLETLTSTRALLPCR